MRCISFFLILYSWIYGIPLWVPARHYYDTTVPIAHHPGHYPFISCLTFRKMADHRIDQTVEWFDPETVKLGDIIYVNIWLLPWFASYVHNQIPFPYILISADVDGWVPDPAIQKLLYDPKVAAWFCRNVVFSHHPKIFQIPMGTDYSFFSFETTQVGSLLNMMAKRVPQKHLLYMNHYPRLFGDRIRLIEMFENEPYCFTKVRSHQGAFVHTPFEQYIEEIASSKFVLSPIGYELDCVRTWEAIVLGAIPIVEHTFIDPLFEGLPVLIIDDWSKITRPLLEERLDALKTRNCEKAFFPYWEKKIRKVQEQVREGVWEGARLEATAFNESEMADLCSIFSGHESILYKGFLTTLRPVQLAKYFSLCLYDPWLNAEMFARFDGAHKESITLIDNQEDFRAHFMNHRALFLDLTYFRNSLLTNFSIDFMRPSHLLKRHLIEVYENMPLFSLICGTSAKDSYVSKVLAQLAEELHLEIQQLGSFWFIEKGF
jgi:hypothetical protein